MSFLFASSHLPAVRSTRPEPEEEEDENMQALPRSGGVRASSHLEERGPNSARRADGSPATRRADAASDWLGRLKEQLDQQRTRSAPAAPDERPRRWKRAKEAGEWLQQRHGITLGEGGVRYWLKKAGES